MQRLHKLALPSLGQCSYLALCAAFLASCSGGGTSSSGFSGTLPSTGAGTLPAAAQHIYVANDNISAVTVFPATASGNVAPVATIDGAGCNVLLPFDVAIGPDGLVYIENNGRYITVYTVSQTGGPTALIRTIQGSNTQFNGVFMIAVDSRGTLYVSNLGGGLLDFSRTRSILAFAPGSDGNVAPIANISGGNTNLQPSENDQVIGVAVDAQRNIYTLNDTPHATGGGGEVLEFAAGSDGNVAPIARIAGSNTQLSDPVDVAIGPSGNIYVANLAGHSITVYAPGANGNVAPIKTISGSHTNLGLPLALAVDQQERLYVSDEGTPLGNAIEIFDANANGDASPLATIAGSDTELNGNGGIAVH